MTATAGYDQEGELVRRPSDRVALVGGLVSVVALGLFAATTSFTSVETSVFRHVNELPGWVYPLVWPVMQLGTFGAVTVATLIALALGRPRLALELVSAGLLAYLAAKGLKELVGRGRPADHLSGVTIRGHPAGGMGWPSGHTATATALAATLVPFVRVRWRPLVWAVPVGVGLARMVVGAHWPLDVVGGFAVGWTAAAIVHVAGGVPAPGAPSVRDPVVG